MLAVDKYDFRNEEKGKKLYKALLIIFICLGSLISGYLLYRHVILSTYNITKIDVCSAVFGKGCDNALISSEAFQFGLPLAGWGMIYFFTLASILLLPDFFGKIFSNPVRSVVFYFTLAGCTASVSFLVLMLIKPTLFCPLCAVIHTINFLIFLCIIKIKKYPGWFGSSNVPKTANPSSTEKSGNGSFKLKVAGFLFVLFIAISLYFGLQIITGATNLYKENVFDSRKNLEEFINEHPDSIPVDADDPVLGLADSPVEIIVFSDFQCPSCRYFAQVLNELKSKYTGKFHVVYKHFPLGIACNSVIDKDVHPRACEEAMAAEAAKQQGKFWEYHDLLFTTNLNKVDETVCSLAAKLGLDQKKFEESRTGKMAQNKIDKTVQLANSLGISGTPAVFINGRNVKNFSLESMQSLIDYQLDHQK